MTLKLITIKKNCQGLRLDKFLTEELDDITRSQIKKMIKAGEILVNNKEATVHHFLKEDDSIKIINKKPKIKEGKNGIATSPTASRNDIIIISENDDFLIIEKPAGLLVHPTDKNETNTLVDWLVAKYPELKKIGEDPSRASIVHRLDKDVSGLMIIPRNQDSFDYFKQQFKNHKIIKKYTALVYGEIEKDEDEINFPIGRSTNKNGIFAAHPPNRGEKLNGKDKPAITTFKTLKTYTNYTLLEIEIFTGRTHQIRVHMLAYGYPIVGDKLYQKRKSQLHVEKTPLSRIFLHASRLSFIGPDKKQYEFESKLPKILNEYLKNLK